ncbi:hypothetical protein VTI74DRAFT_4108 [Chaetomium olivicolor]
MHLMDDAALHKRQWGGKPWYCYLWPPACEISTQPGGGTTPTTTKKRTSTTKVNPSPTTTPKTIPAPPKTTQPAPKPPATTQPTTSQQQPEPSTQPDPAPSPTPQLSPAVNQPQPTSAGNPGATTTPVNPVIVQPGATETNSPVSSNPTPQGVDSGAGSGNDSEGSSSTGGINPPSLSGDSGNNGYPATGSRNQPGQSGGATASNPTASTGPVTGGIGDPSGSGGTGAGAGGSSAGGGLPPGAIAGIVVGLLLFLALLALLLYRFRRSPAVQRILAPFSKAGGEGGFHRMETPGADSMGRNLISPSPGPAAGSAGAAAAGAFRSRNSRSPTSQQPPMRQSRSLHPLTIPPAALARRDSNRVSIFTNDSVASTGALTPSPVSPMAPGNLLSPGTVRTSRPIQEPPDPRIISSANARISGGSVSSISTGSAISAALSPGQMAWPMPPGTPPVIKTRDGPQYINFQQSGQTVVRIYQPPRGNRRSGGY